MFEGLSHTYVFEVANALQLSCGHNQCIPITCGLKWSFSTEPVRAESGTWTIAIEMTLLTRLSPNYHHDNFWFKGAALQDHLENPPPPSEAPFGWAPLRSAAFRPKQYTLTLSRGRFIEPFHYFIKAPYPLLQPYYHRHLPNRYTHQIVFDKSPYPPLEEWVESYGKGTLKGTLEHYQFWERTNFVRGEILKKDQTWAEILDLKWWLSPYAGDGYTRSR